MNQPNHLRACRQSCNAGILQGLVGLEPGMRELAGGRSGRDQWDHGRHHCRGRQGLRWTQAAFLPFSPGGALWL